MKPFLILFLSLWVSALFAQQKDDSTVKENSLSLISGYNQFKDENLNPKVHHGLLIGVLYQHSKISKIISEYGAGLKVSLLNTGYEGMASSADIQIQGNYNYLFTITGNDKLKYYLGPAAYLQYGASAYFNWDESHLYWANYLSAGVGNRISYQLSLKKVISLTLEIPVVSLISRPENNRQYKIDDMTFVGIVRNLCSNLEGALPNNHFYFKTGIEWKTILNNKKKCSFGYNFRYHYMQAIKGMAYQNMEHALFYKFIF
jgi:hypothetical protein